MQCCSRTGFAFRSAKTVDVVGGDSDGLVHLRLRQHQGAGCGATYGNATGTPLIADDAQAIQICEGVAGGERLAQGDCATDGDCARGQVINVDDRRRGRTGFAFRRTKAINVAGGDSDGLAHLSLSEHQRTAGCAANCNAVGQPLVSDGTGACAGDAV